MAEVTPIKKKPEDGLHGLVVDHAFKIDGLAREVGKVKETLGLHEQQAEALIAALQKVTKAQIDAAIDAIRKEFTTLLAQREDGEKVVTKTGTIETPRGIHKLNIVENHKKKP